MSIPGTERRQSPRIRVRVPVVLVVEQVEDSCETVEIGQGGVFVATFEPLLLQQLIVLRLELTENNWLDIRGMVVRIVDEDDAFRLDTEPGVGIQFYGIDVRAEKAWAAYFERTLKKAGFFEDADASTLKGELSTIHGSAPVVDLPEPIECLEDAQVMLARGFSVDEVSRAAGLDPSIVAAALSAQHELQLPEDSSEVGRTVEGISLLSTKPEPFAFEEDAPTIPRTKLPKSRTTPSDGLLSPEPITVRLKPKQGTSAPVVPLGPSTSIIKIIGPDPAEEDTGSIAEAKTDVDLVSHDEPTGRQEHLDQNDDVEGTLDDDIEATLDDDGDLPPRIRIVALGPLQPPPFESEEPITEREKRRRPHLVPALSAPLAPTSILPHVVFRLEIPSMAALEEFKHEALEAGGVFILTVDLRHTGTPVIVFIVHPVNHDEFHIPGTVTHSLGSDRGVNVKFTLVTQRTIESFDRFIAQGKTIETTEPEHAYPSQEITMVTRTSEVFVQGAEGAAIPRDTQRIKLSEIEPLKKE